MNTLLLALISTSPAEAEILRAIEFKELSVENAIQALAPFSGMKVQVAPDIPGTIDLSVRDVKADTLLRWVIQQGDVVSTMKNGTLHIDPRRTEKPLSQKNLGQAKASEDDPLERIVPHLVAENVDVAVGVEKLFLPTNLSYLIAGDVKGEIWTNLKGQPFEVDLQHVTRQVDATYRIEGKVFQIIRRCCGGG